MAIGAEIPLAHPAMVSTIRVGAEIMRGVDLTAASARHDETRGRGCGGMWAGLACVGTGVAVRSCGETRKGVRLAATRTPWWRGVREWRWDHGTVAEPHPMEHTAQPQKSDQR